MRFSENRRIAWIVLLVCVLASIILLGAGSLNSERKALAKIFTNGADTSSSIRISMDADLDACAESANLLAETAKLYVDDDALIGNVQAQAAELSASDGPDGRYQIFQQLNASVDSLYTELMRAGKEDEDEIARQYGNFKGACDRIDRNGDQPDEYITQAKAFNEDLSGFPANLLGGIFGVKALDTYGR